MWFLPAQERNDTASGTDDPVGPQAFGLLAFSLPVLAHRAGLPIAAAMSYEHYSLDDLLVLVTVFLKQLQPSLVSHNLRTQVYLVTNTNNYSSFQLHQFYKIP